MDGNWRRWVVLANVVLACAACALDDKEVGSACRGGVCSAAALDGPSCVVVAQDVRWAFIRDLGTGAGPRPDLPPSPICLKREYAQDAQGKVNCKLWWKLSVDDPVTPRRETGTPRSCSELPFLSPVDESEQPFDLVSVSADEVVCAVDQVPAPTASGPSEDGWFYQEDHPDCVIGDHAVPTAVAFTEGASHTGFTAIMHCAEASIADARDAGTAATVDEVCTLPAGSDEHTGSVGDPCRLDPPDGLALESAVYLQTGASECGTGVCLGHHYSDDPSRVCDEAGSPEGCVSKSEIEKRKYCSCRCDAPAGSAGACECPDEFRCVDLLPAGPVGLRGSYCARISAVGLD